MSRAKYTEEEKIQAAIDYLNGRGSYQSLAEAIGAGKTTVKSWVRKYRAHGKAGFSRGTGNNRYTKAFKMMCVEAVLRGEGSVNEIVAKYNISSDSVLRSWIMRYNANMELKDYEPRREVYMAEARRKTTLEERKEIVEYCVAHGNDYKGTAALYDVSYSQVYSWVRKYQESGEEGLADRLREEIHLDVNMADSPVNTVAQGLAQVIKKAQYRSLAYTIEGLGNK